VDVLRRLGLTFPISGPATAAGIAAVRDVAHRERVFEHNRDQLARFCNDLQALGLSFLPSNGNFVLLDFEGQQKTAKQAYDFLDARGIVGRMFNSADYRNMLRITVGLDAEMRLATQALRDFLGASA
jgi:histidinol-phosphate aminotransferase